MQCYQHRIYSTYDYYFYHWRANSGSEPGQRVSTGRGHRTRLIRDFITDVSFVVHTRCWYQSRRMQVTLPSNNFSSSLSRLSKGARFRSVFRLLSLSLCCSTERHSGSLLRHKTRCYYDLLFLCTSLRLVFLYWCVLRSGRSHGQICTSHY